MANAIYPKYKEALLGGLSNIALTGTNVKVSLVNADLTPYEASTEFYSDLDDVTDQGVLSTVIITNPTVAAGLFNGDNVSFPAADVQSGDPVAEALLIWIDTGTAGTSRLVAWIDTGVTGLPVTPQGDNIDVNWNTSGIFQL